jgi:hypothetical protein
VPVWCSPFTLKCKERVKRKHAMEGKVRKSINRVSVVEIDRPPKCALIFKPDYTTTWGDRVINTCNGVFDVGIGFSSVRVFRTGEVIRKYSESNDSQSLRGPVAKRPVSLSSLSLSLILSSRESLAVLAWRFHHYVNPIILTLIQIDSCLLLSALFYDSCRFSLSVSFCRLVHKCTVTQYNTRHKLRGLSVRISERLRTDNLRCFRRCLQVSSTCWPVDFSST